MRTFLVFLSAYTLSQFFRSFLAVVAPDLARELALSPQQLGNISAIWFWVFALAQLAVGWSLDRYGPRTTMPIFMLAAAAGSAVLALADGYGMCLLGMGLIGLGSSPIFMSAVYTFARTFEPARLSMLTSWVLGIGSAGNLLGATPLAYAVELWGWRPTFLGIGCVTLLVAAVAALLLPRIARIARPAGAERQGFAGTLLQILSIRGLWPLLPLIFLSYAVMLAERGLWIGPYLAEVHALGAVDRGNVVLIVAAAMSLGALAYGPLDRLLATRKWIVLWGTLLTGLLFIALGRIPDLPLAGAAVILAGIGAIGMTYAVLLAHVRAYLPEHLLGRGITLINFVFFLGAGILQPLSGLLVSRLTAGGAAPADVFGALHLVFAGLLLLSAFVYLWCEDRPP